MHNFEHCMTANKLYAPSIRGQLLDVYLAKGWFRMGQAIFTTHFLRMDQNFFPALWLRYQLQTGAGARIEKKIRKLLLPGLTYCTGPWVYSEEQEALYFEHALHTGLPIYSGLYRLMHGNSADNVYNTWQLTIHNNGQLIALGLYDRGAQASAGIISIYDGAYKKFSLGKLLMYLKMQECLRNDEDFFYPGYAVPGCDRFNYKLDILPEFTEYFDPVPGQWLASLGKAELLPDYLALMIARLQPITHLDELHEAGALLLHYAYFDGALQDNYLSHELEHPVFVYLPLPMNQAADLAIVYNCRHLGYQVFLSEKLDMGWIEYGPDGLTYEQVLHIINEVGVAANTDALLELLQQKLLPLFNNDFGPENFSIFMRGKIA